MTYDTNLQETQMTSMPELYHFYAGDRQEYITSWRTDLNFLGETYLARPVKRSQISVDAQFGPVKLSVEAPLLDNFIRYISTNPIEPTRLKLYRAISDDLSDFVVLFTGTLRRMGISQRQARAEFESKARQLRVRLPKILYQSYCNWDVFDADCGASKSRFRVNAVVTVSLDTLTSSTYGTYPDGYFTAGRATFGEDSRWILDHTGNVLTLQVPFDDRVYSGVTIKTFPGCDGSPDTCKDRFDNYKNFLGFPYIPSNNPCLYGFK